LLLFEEINGIIDKTVVVECAESFSSAEITCACTCCESDFKRDAIRLVILARSFGRGGFTCRTFITEGTCNAEARESVIIEDDKDMSRSSFNFEEDDIVSTECEKAESANVGAELESLDSNATTVASTLFKPRALAPGLIFGSS
jgi:hypothetical protein